MFSKIVGVLCHAAWIGLVLYGMISSFRDWRKKVKDGRRAQGNQSA
jgi:hypothetical protein